MFALASEVVAFNFLDKNVFGEHPLLKAYDKEELIDYSFSFTQNCKVIDDYLDDDVTVVVYK